MYSQFAEDMLIALYQEADAGTQMTTFQELKEKYGLESRQSWAQQLAEEWDSNGFAKVWKHIGDPMTWRIGIAAAGMRYIESEYGDLNGVGEILSPVPSNSPENGSVQSEADRLYSQIVPASDRIVSPSHNAPEFMAALSKVEDARSKIDESNTLEINEKKNFLVNIDAGLSVLKNARDFAVGAIRYLVLDRLKNAFEGAIEDAFKLALSTAIVALAAFLLTLV